MTPVTINFDTTTINYISQKSFDISSYLTKLVKEDMLLNEIEESKRSWKHTLGSLDDLDK